MDVPKGDSPNSAAAAGTPENTLDPRAQNFLAGVRPGSGLTCSGLLDLHEELNKQLLTVGVGAKRTPAPHQGRVLFPSPPLVNNQPSLQGSAEHAPSVTSPPNFHGPAGSPTYNPQPGLSVLPLLPPRTYFPIRPGTVAVPRQNQSINIVRTQGSHQVQPSPDTTSFISRGAGPLPVRKRSAQDHQTVNIVVNRARTQPLLPTLVPPPVQSEASQATQGWVDLSQSLRPLLSQARTAATSQQHADLKNAYEQLIRARAKVASSLLHVQQIASSQTPLAPAPSSIIRIQREEEPHRLVGHNCYFCKRDLSYPPEGPIVENPENPPEAAVLACGHPFHSFCLNRITPPEMASDPPCIPCALSGA